MRHDRTRKVRLYLLIAHAILTVTVGSFAYLESKKLTLPETRHENQ